MRRFAVFAAVALAAPAAIAQDRVPTKYWPSLEIGFPVPAEALQARDGRPKPDKLRLYAATGRGKWEQVNERSADDLQPIPDRPKGFLYTARGDGEEEFAVQLVYPDGTVSPTTEKLRPDFRIIFDTRPPAVTLLPKGRFGVEWSIQDDNLDAAQSVLEVRYAGDTRWFPVRSPRSGWADRDSYTSANWSGLDREGRGLEVRMTARDKAGIAASSRIVRLPNTGDVGRTRDDDDLRPRVGSTNVQPDRGDGRDVPGQPQIEYSNKPSLTLRAKLNTVTRSGVKAVHLYVKELTESASGEWKYAHETKCNVEYKAADPVVPIIYNAPKDGRYGFIVIPESGAGQKEPAPRPSAPPQYLVEVDTKPPEVKLTNVLVSPGAGGPRVEFEWKVRDPNLMREPITLEWAESKEGPWKLITDGDKLPNAGRWVWNVPDTQPYKFFVRIRAVDLATNSGTDVYPKEVNIDLDRPSATIEGVKPGGGGGTNDFAPSNTSEKPPVGGTPLPTRAPETPPAKPTAPDVLPPIGK